MRNLPGRLGQSPQLPLGLLTVVLGLDAMQTVLPSSVLMNGALDEPAHLATAVLTMFAAVGESALRRHPTVTLSALLASIVIDVDHIPLYAGVSRIAEGGRPFSHSLITVVGLLAASGALPRARCALAGAALGVGLHFLRDVGTGPGLPLWWPVSTKDARVPYALYVVGLIFLAGLATRRALLAQNSCAPVPPAARGTPPEPEPKVSQ